MAKGRSREGNLQILVSPRKNGPDSLFKEVRVKLVLSKAGRFLSRRVRSWGWGSFLSSKMGGQQLRVKARVSALRSQTLAFLTVSTIFLPSSPYPGEGGENRSMKQNHLLTTSRKMIPQLLRWATELPEESCCRLIPVICPAIKQKAAHHYTTNNESKTRYIQQ